MISAPFELLKLPKLNSKQSQDIPIEIQDNSIFLGIPGSSVNKLSIKPPQVLSAHSVSPSTKFTCICSFQNEIYAYATSERSKYFLKLVVNTNDNTVLTKEIKYKAAKIYAHDDKLFVLNAEDSKFEIFDSNLDLVWSEPKSDSKVFLYSQVTESGDILVLSANSEHDKLFGRTLKLDNAGVLETGSGSADLQSTLQSNGSTGSTGSTGSRNSASFFSYNNNQIYQTCGSNLFVYLWPSMECITKFELVENGQLTGLQALPNNNVVISRETGIELIDCTFQSLISSYSFSNNPKIRLLGYSLATASLVLLNGSDKVMGLSVEPTNGTLLESLNKLSAKRLVYHPMTDIFNGFEAPVKSIKSVAQTELMESETEIQLVLTDLKTFIQQRNGVDFSKIIEYLKNPQLRWRQWVECQESNSSDVSSDLSLKYYEPTDRNADRRLIYEICKLTFMPRVKPFVPINVPNYLLSHPLFPTNEPEFKKILTVLELSDLVLYKQALKCLVGVTAEDLVMALTSRDTEAFKTAAQRLLTEFSNAKILDAIKHTFESLRSYSLLSILVNRIVKYSESLQLLTPFIDAIGLLNWNVDDLKRLLNRVKPQIEYAQECAKADVSIQRLLANANAELKEPKRKNKRHNYNTNVEFKDRIPEYSIETLAL